MTDNNDTHVLHQTEGRLHLVGAYILQSDPTNPPSTARSVHSQISWLSKTLGTQVRLEMTVAFKCQTFAGQSSTDLCHQIGDMYLGFGF